MNRSHSQWVSVVEFILERQGRRKNVEIAIKEAGVPRHMADKVREYFKAPVDIQAPSLLTEDRDDQVPLCKLDGSVQEPRFTAFKNFLLDQRNWSKGTVDNLTEASAKLIARLPQPDSAKPYQYRGLVVGYIQSGKTASMASLISRAGDQGYRLFIVLSGIFSDLRAQTQTRMDQEVLGDTDDPDEKPVVENDPDITWLRLTKSGKRGEFGTGTISPKELLKWDVPKVAIIKKNVRVLERILGWLRNANVDLSKLPALVIDDEADLASINTNANRFDEDGDPIDPSKTNKGIRDLLQILPKCVYVGYTATPFANVLIDATVEDDLYPRDFIAVLPEPAGYLGPRQLFGLGMEASELAPEDPQPALYDVIRHVSQDQLDELEHPDPMGEVPELIRDSMLAFLLSCCARMERGQSNEHYSMLVHPSVKTAEHSRYREVIDKELAKLKIYLQRPKQFKELPARAKSMWEKDFVPATRAIPDGKKLVRSFDQIWDYARSLVEQMEVKVLNRDSEDELKYFGAPKRYIVVGGARLSRGLTLTGLSVSVFLRDSKEYDTLLQMGRWFGYRKNYEDLTRIFVEESRADDFASLARVEQELREDLGKYAKEPDPPSPREVMPRIRSHPSLAVTSAMKMGAGAPLNLSFAGKLAQTVSLPLDEPSSLTENQAVARKWLEDLGKPDKSITKGGSHFWVDVSPEKILNFLKDYRFGNRAVDVTGGYLSKYISFQNRKKELIAWDVVLPKGGAKFGPYQWTSELRTNKIKRALLTRNSIRVLSTHSDETLWSKTLGRNPEDKKRGVIFLYVIDGAELRKDAKRNGNLAITDVIGFVIKFPASKSAATADYVGQTSDLIP